MSATAGSIRLPWGPRALDWIYRRYRRNAIHAWLAISMAGISLLAWPAQHVTQFPLWGAGWWDGEAMLVFTVSGAVVTLLLVPAMALRGFAPIVRFVRGEPVDPLEVWESAVHRMPVLSMQFTALYCVVGNVPGVLWAGREHDFGASTYVAAWIAESMITFAAGMFFILVWEVALRPVLRELHPLLPADFRPPPHWLTLGRRSALASTAVMLYAGAAVSGLVAGAGSPGGRLLITVTASLAAAATFGGVITWLLSHSIVTRVEELGNAVTRIGQGDYGVRLALWEGDELDDAGAAMNAMAARLQEQDAALRQSRARLASVADRERRRMERDLRVGVERRLRRIDEGLVELEAATAGDGTLVDECRSVRANLAEAVREIRSLANGIYPERLSSGGLETALADAATRSALPTRVEGKPTGRLRRDIESAVYFCCLEALQNAAKHAGDGASAVVRLARTTGTLTFEVTDDGAGFAASEDGHGLTNMRDRIRALGGEVAVRSAPGEGTSVLGWVPCG